MTFRVPEKKRVRFPESSPYYSDARSGNNGAFRLLRLHCLASDGLGWEHVSVSRDDHRMPTWADMCKVKAIFWDPEDVVMQLHPRESEYVNNHPNCLHLWRPVDVEIPTPPPITVGLRGLKIRAR